MGWTQGRPRQSFATWLTNTGREVPVEIRAHLLTGMHGNLPIYVGGVLNTITVALLLAIRIGTPFFIAAAVFEIVMALVRFPVMLASRRGAREGRQRALDAYVILTLLWSLGVGLGSAAALLSGDRTAALVACASSSAMLGGICFRFYPAPRMVVAMLLAMGMPNFVAAMVIGEVTLIVGAALIPLYIYAMAAAAWRLHGRLLKTLVAQREDAHRARHDTLTGLLNREGLAEIVDGRPEGPLALFFIDLDGFKQVNDSLGHAAGDRLLAMVAGRLRGDAAPGESVARLGGDEFVLIAPIDRPEAAMARGDHLVAALTGLPYLMAEDGIIIGASIGVAMRPAHGAVLQDLLVAADEALYRAKSSGSERCCLAMNFDDDDLSPTGLRTAA